tara:strand:- start:1274 stop:2830 length:1557 start_codon:yes stop_codon:yes gene_type:complete
MIDHLKPLIGKLSIFAKEKMGFDHPPRLFLKNNHSNAEMPLGRTAHYNPNQESVTLFITNRHPKDILRSLAHELVHHTQNLRGDLAPEKMTNLGKNYAQDDEHMRNMEKEAYLVGNMCFRDWEDSLNDEDTKRYKLAESRFLKENKTMTTKITKEFLKETIRKILSEQLGPGFGGLNTSAVRPDSTQQTLDALRQGLKVNKQKAAARAKAGGGSGRRRGMSPKARKQKILADKYFGPDLTLADVQDALLVMGYYGGQSAQRAANDPEFANSVADNKYGPNTEKAIKAFQADVKGSKKQNPIEGDDIDGLVGEDTLDALAHVLQQGKTALKSGRNIPTRLMDPLEPGNLIDKIPDGYKHKESQFVSMGQSSMAGDVEAVPSGDGKASADASDTSGGQSRYDKLVNTPGTLKKGSPVGKMGGTLPPKTDAEKEEDRLSRRLPIKKEENEELEEAEMTAKQKKFAALAPPEDEITYADKIAGATKNESKIQTPEQESTLYEQRFAERNKRLFQKLLKEWAK